VRGGCHPITDCGLHHMLLVLRYPIGTARVCLLLIALRL
jgi:hypothetical protein